MGYLQLQMGIGNTLLGIYLYLTIPKKVLILRLKHIPAQTFMFAYIYSTEVRSLFASVITFSGMKIQ